MSDGRFEGYSSVFGVMQDSDFSLHACEEQGTEKETSKVDVIKDRYQRCSSSTIMLHY